MDEDLAKFFGGITLLPKDTNLIPKDDMFDAEGVLMARPSSFWTAKTRAEKMLFGHTHGLYAFPTTELVSEIHQMIGGRDAIEIGAGNGGLARALGIIATDSYQQERPGMAAAYKAAGQPPVKYGAHVLPLAADKAVAIYKPQVVVAAWVTHQYNPRFHDQGGNMWGVDEHLLLQRVDEYIFIGNTEVHGGKPILQDMQNGLLTSHYVKEFYVGTPMLQSRSSRGLDMILRIARK